MSSTVEDQKNKLNFNRRILRNISVELHEWLSLSALGVPAEHVKVHKLLPLRIFVDQSDIEIERNLTRALQKFVGIFDFYMSDELPEIRGSWYKKWFVRSADRLSQPDVTEKLKKIERALEMQGLDKPQAEVDERKANAASNLIKSLENIPNAALQVGSILVIKITKNSISTIQVKTLTTNKLIEIESNQDLLSKPEEILKKLSCLCGARGSERRLVELSADGQDDGALDPA